MLKEIIHELENIKDLKRQTKEIIKNAPEGNLRCAICNGHYQYYLGEIYLGKKRKEEISQIAQKQYCINLSQKLDKYLKSLEELRDMYESEELENVYRNLHPGRKQIVEPLVKPIEKLIEEFEKIEYIGRFFTEEDTTEYYTMRGERVRSKSEKIIADELNRYNIPYKYEMPIELQINKKAVKFYPDFIALNKTTGRRWIIEHLGMMDNELYYESVLQKLDAYEKNNILIGESLILLHETSHSPLNVVTLRKYIEMYLC